MDPSSRSRGVDWKIHAFKRCSARSTRPPQKHRHHLMAITSARVIWPSLKRPAGISSVEADMTETKANLYSQLL